MSRILMLRLDCGLVDLSQLRLLLLLYRYGYLVMVCFVE